MVEGDSPTLNEAASRFLGQLPPGESGASQPEVNRFVRYYGGDRPLSGLTAHEVSGYAERLSGSDTEYGRKLKLLRAFLAYARKEGWSRNNLGTHIKSRKARAVPAAAPPPRPKETVALTRQKYEELEAELVSLKSQRHVLIDEIRRAAADKDFRENAPLAAAREQRGHVEGRLKEIEETLKAATIIGEEKREAGRKSGVGDSIVLCDLASGQERCYMIVDPREGDPTRGKISLASPLGKALLGRRDGDTVEITAPAGKLRYRIKEVKR